MPTNKVFRRLPTKQSITEVKFSGRNFTRQRINHEIE